MFGFSNISKNLIVVSVVSSMLVFWLGARFLSEAYTQHSDSAQLKLAIQPEQSLFNLAKSINAERAATQTVLVSEEDAFEQMDELYDLSDNTLQMLNNAIEEVTQSRMRSPNNIQHRYSEESIQFVITELKERFKGISYISGILFTQNSLPANGRDEIVRMQWFDAYNNLIRDINELRTRIHFLPDRNYRNVVSAHNLKNAIWNFNEAINQNSILLETYLWKVEIDATENINRENLALRIFQQRERANSALFQLAEFFEKNDTGNVSKELYSEMYNSYNEDVLLQENSLSRSVSYGNKPEISLAQWQESNANLQTQITQFIDDAISNTLSSAENINRQTKFAFALNALLVLLCVVMAIASFGVSKKIQFQADYDDLTQVPNRRTFIRQLHQYISQTRVSANEKMVLMTLDLNGFKTINDTMGHVVGDKLLVQVANKMKAVLDDDMTLARMGGDEFAILFITNEIDKPAKFANNIKSVFGEKFIIDGAKVRIDSSIGYSSYPDDARSAEELQISSDFAMYNAKQDGGRKVQAYDLNMATQYENRIRIEKDLAIAIEENQLELHYQPQFNLSINAVDAVEALVRWNHPTRGTILPFEFIDIAEESGQMPALGSWVLNEACRQAAIWNPAKNNLLRVAINVSVHQIMQSGFVQDVIDALQKHNLDACCLEIEVTENVVMADVDFIVKSLEKLKSSGIKIALDDFGTGYSSLSQLKNLPLNTLKIDRSFIIMLDDDLNNSRSVMATIASIADIYNLDTVAEGVETDNQLAKVRELGIDVVQGYYYSKPVPSSELLDTVNSINWDNSQYVKAA